MSKGAGERIVLASASAARAKLLRAAGVAITCDPAAVDEAEAKRSLHGAGASAAEAAAGLGELKARRVSARHAGALVVGADQILQCEGRWFDKPEDLGAARRQLLALRGRTHELVTAAVIVLDGARIWHHVDRARLAMRPFSDAFLETYLAACGNGALGAVGAYELEGRGAQLFDRVEGDYFTVLGLPLLPLLDFLRARGALAT